MPSVGSRSGPVMTVDAFVRTVDRTPITAGTRRNLQAGLLGGENGRLTGALVPHTSEMTPPPEPDAPDDAIDEALQETFPASDAPANTGETGIRVGRIEPDAALAVHHDEAARQFVVAVGGERAYLQYEESPRATTIIHT